jgi:hypothetical protein
MKVKASDMIANASNTGEVFASERIGKTVTFWCRSLTGGDTDSILISLTFATEAIAHAIQMEAAWMGVEA